MATLTLAERAKLLRETESNPSDFWDEGISDDELAELWGDSSSEEVKTDPKLQRLQDQLLLFLADSKCRRLFQDFLKKTWCEEILELFFTIQSFQQQTDVSSRLSVAQNIWDRFFAPNCESEFNCSITAKKRLQTRLPLAPPDLFEEIFTLDIQLLVGKYVCFLDSDEWKAHLDQGATIQGFQMSTNAVISSVGQVLPRPEKKKPERPKLPDREIPQLREGTFSIQIDSLQTINKVIPIKDPTQTLADVLLRIFVTYEISFETEITGHDHRKIEPSTKLVDIPERCVFISQAQSELAPISARKNKRGSTKRKSSPAVASKMSSHSAKNPPHLTQLAKSHEDSSSIGSTPRTARFLSSGDSARERRVDHKLLPTPLKSLAKSFDNVETLKSSPRNPSPQSKKSSPTSCSPSSEHTSPRSPAVTPLASPKTSPRVDELGRARSHSSGERSSKPSIRRTKATKDLQFDPDNVPSDDAQQAVPVLTVQQPTLLSIPKKPCSGSISGSSSVRFEGSDSARVSRSKHSLGDDSKKLDSSRDRHSIKRKSISDPPNPTVITPTPTAAEPKSLNVSSKPRRARTSSSDPSSTPPKSLTLMLGDRDTPESTFKKGALTERPLTDKPKLRHSSKGNMSDRSNRKRKSSDNATDSKFQSRIGRRSQSLEAPPAFLRASSDTSALRKLHTPPTDHPTNLSFSIEEKISERSSENEQSLTETPQTRHRASPDLPDRSPEIASPGSSICRDPEERQSRLHIGSLSVSPTNEASPLLKAQNEPQNEPQKEQQNEQNDEP